MTENVGDRDLAPAVTASTGAVTPDEERWIVVVEDDGRPTEVIAPGGAVAEDAVISDAAVPVEAAIDSDELLYLTGATAVVVTSGGAVVGIWSGDDLVDAAMHGGTRAAGEAMQGDLQLPGRISKKNITRRCRYTEHGRSCTTILVVPEKPQHMPQCPPQAGLSSHTFGW
jgi:hypothetical protein